MNHQKSFKYKRPIVLSCYRVILLGCQNNKMINLRLNCEALTLVQRMTSRQQRHIFSVSYPARSDDNMFSRKREMECLSNVLTSVPQLSVITTLVSQD